MLVNPRLFKYEDLPKIKKDLNNWTLVPMFSSKNVNTCGFYAGMFPFLFLLYFIKLNLQV